MTLTSPRPGRGSDRTGRRPSGGRDLTVDVLPLTHAAGAVAAFQAAAASLVVVLVPVVLTWVVTGGGTAAWIDVVKLATMLWLLGQHAGLAVEGGHLSLVPLGLAAVPLLACAYAGTRLARSLDPNAERIAAGSTRAAPEPAPRTALLTMGITHGLLGVLVGALCATAELQPVLWQAFAGPAVVAGIGGAFGSLVYARGGARGVLAALVDAVPPGLRRSLVPAATALVVQGVAAAAAVVTGIAVGMGRVVDLYQALGGGLLGAMMITLMQLLLLPNVVIWAAAVLAGPGFAVGAGTSVSPLTSTLGPLPAVPILGALPDPGPKPGYLLVLLLVPVLAGAMAGEKMLRADETGSREGAAWWSPLHDVIVLGLVCGAVAGTLAWLSGGPAGPGRLGDVGPNPLLVGGAFAAEVAIGAALLLFVRRGAPRVSDALAGGLAGRRDGGVGRLLPGRYRRES